MFCLVVAGGAEQYEIRGHRVGASFLSALDWTDLERRATLFEWDHQLPRMRVPRRLERLVVAREVAQEQRRFGGQIDAVDRFEHLTASEATLIHCTCGRHECSRV